MERFAGSRRLRHALRVRLAEVVRDAVEPVVVRQTDELSQRLDGLDDQLRALRDAMHDREVRDRRDMLAAGEREAVESSATFVRESMSGARTFPAPAETLAHALALAPTGGMALEFGVYSGTTLRQIASARAGSAVFGFDSFEGLPEDWRAGFQAGTFAVEEIPQVEGAELVVGWFSDTLPGFLEAHPGPVDLLHLDADLYSSTATVLELVGPRLRPGSVIVFDEYLNHPGWQDGEHQAWREHVAAHHLEFVYEAFTHDNEQVVVVITGTRELSAPQARVGSIETSP